MTDIFNTEKRSEIMSNIRSYGTNPEIFVRSLVHRMGFRFRLHRNDLPGSPDIVLPKHKKVIFIHGCFWHGHKNCNRSKRPSTNLSFWNKKLDSNIKRDRQNLIETRKKGWDYLVLWSCEIKKKDIIVKKLNKFLNL